MRRRNRKQQTIGSSVSYAGISLHSGEPVSIRFSPADANHGIVFRRADLPDQPRIPATIEYVCDTSRNTTLGIGDVRLYTVEHVLAAIRAYEIDNVLIDIGGTEPPAGNGSSDVFVRMIEDAVIVEQEAEIPCLQLQSPVYWSEGDIHLVALPSEQFRVSYTLSYPQNAVLRGQYFSLWLDPVSFKQEIASCRSFGLYEEIGPLLDKGLIKGCSLANSVVIHGDAVFSKEGLFFPDEMVRHKILDLIGDLSLVGIPFSAHIIAVRSGHATHRRFAELLLQVLTKENAR